MNGHAEFERHIKSRIILVTFTGVTREVMNRILALENRPGDPLQTWLRDRTAFQGAASHETTTYRGEHYGIEKFGEARIEWTVDKGRLGRVECEFTFTEV